MDHESQGNAFRPVAVLARTLWMTAIPPIAGVVSRMYPGLAAMLVAWAAVVLAVNWLCGSAAACATTPDEAC